MQPYILGGKTDCGKAFAFCRKGDKLQEMGLPAAVFARHKFNFASPARNIFQEVFLLYKINQTAGINSNLV
jgi:hypothetical protein